ncbi:MAG: hypothetical protein EHM87_21260 [Burkholderiales bacterium]|nr:MAG: hypothetical protein EHM87_21260 [Burkholderiales bacterium]
MRRPGPRTVLVALQAACALIVMLAVVGAVRGFSPVPWWDMWDGYLEFYLRVRGGETAAWWGQHNEHRLLLSRLLFWPDIAWFGGRGVLPIVANYAVVAGVAAAFWHALRETAGKARSTDVLGLIGAVGTAWLFLWIQEFNFAGAFQIQFFLAYAVPLWALLALHRSTLPGGSAAWFGVACLLCAASWGTMANGILIGPLMVLHALVTRQSRVRIAVLALLAALVIGTYLHGYVPGPNQTSTTAALLARPGQAIGYVVLYLGGPFFHLSGRSGVARVVAAFAGVVLLAGSARVAWMLLTRRPTDSLRTALLMFVAFVVGTAIVTAAGRLEYGLSQALSERYATPALMAWFALAVLYTPSLLASRRAGAVSRLAWPAAALVLLMLSFQVRALIRPHEMQIERATGALALAMGVRDPIYVGTVYPDVDRALALARRAADARLSVFADAPLAGLPTRIGRVSEVSEASVGRACAGTFDAVERIDGVDAWVRVTGWVFDEASGRAPDFVEVLDAERRVVGVAMVGKRRADARARLGRGARDAGFRGYLLADRADAALTVLAPALGCRLESRAAQAR